MQYTEVNSSFIAAIGVEPDPGTQDSLTVNIRFRDGAEFQYTGVSEADYKALLNAPSVGSHFHRVFKKVYLGTRV